MAKTTQYVVTTDNGAQEIFTRVGDVAKFTGISKLTKKAIEAGEYPMVSLVEVDDAGVQLDLEHKEEFARLEQEQEEQAMLAELEEPAIEDTDTPDPSKDRALKAIEEAMDGVDDNEHPDLFDQLCDLEDAINDGIALTDTQAELMTKVLTGVALTDTHEEDSEPVSVGEPDGNLPDDASDIEYPEIGSFDTEKAMKKYIKGLKDSELQEWCELEGATWKPNDHQSINRMRMAMAIKALHFPDTAPKKSKKSKSKYAQYTTEQLVQMALENDVEVPDDKGDMKICRMYTIMALRKAGIIE